MGLLKKIKTILENRKRYKSFIKKLKCPTNSFKIEYREELSGIDFFVEVMYINKVIANLYITASNNNDIINIYCKNTIYVTKNFNKNVYNIYNKIVTDCLILNEEDLILLRNNANIWSIKSEKSYVKDIFYCCRKNKINDYIIKYENLRTTLIKNEDDKTLKNKINLNTLKFKNKTFINSINIPYCQLIENSETLIHSKTSLDLSYKIAERFNALNEKDLNTDGPNPRTMRYISLNGSNIDYSSVLLEIPIFKYDKKILLVITIDYTRKEASFELFKLNTTNNEYVKESSKEICFDKHQEEIINLMEYTTLKYFTNLEIIKELEFDVCDNELTDEQIDLLRMYSI